MLCAILNIQNKQWIKKSFIQSQIKPCLIGEDKKRLIEIPSPELKTIQKKIKNGLSKSIFPNNIYSGLKGKSYIDNAKEHINSKYLFKIDISAFFPNTPREKVYRFFKDDLNTSPDVAEILTNFCTFDLSYNITEEIEKFLLQKKIKHKNHLCTGSSPSPILSYLVNKKMFDELNLLCTKNNLIFTLYVDDAFFSSREPISSKTRKKIINIITKHGYNISKNKIRYYTPKNTKKITGVIITPENELKIPNKLQFKIFKYIKEKENTLEYNNLQGCITAAKQINKSAYPSIVEFLKNIPS